MSLSGKRVVITRALHQVGELAELLQERGAIPLSYPCIEIIPAADTTPLDNALNTLDTFDWLLLTSSNTVYALESRFVALGMQLQTAIPPHIKVAAVGTATVQEAYEAFGIQAEVLPDEQMADRLAEILTQIITSGTKILLPQSEIARPDLAAKLTATGADVTAVTAYRTVTGKGGIDLPLLLVEATIDAITFTSSSTVEQFINRMGDNGGDFDLLEGVCIACIGSVTAETARKNGLENIIVPQEFTLAAMVAALEDYFSGK